MRFAVVIAFIVVLCAFLVIQTEAKDKKDTKKKDENKEKTKESEKDGKNGNKDEKDGMEKKKDKKDEDDKIKKEDKEGKKAKDKKENKKTKVVVPSKDECKKLLQDEGMAATDKYPEKCVKCIKDNSITLVRDGKHVDDKHRAKFMECMAGIKRAFSVMKKCPKGKKRCIKTSKINI